MILDLEQDRLVERGMGQVVSPGSLGKGIIAVRELLRKATREETWARAQGTVMETDLGLEQGIPQAHQDTKELVQ